MTITAALVGRSLWLLPRCATSFSLWSPSLVSVETVVHFLDVVKNACRERTLSTGWSRIHDVDFSSRTVVCLSTIDLSCRPLAKKQDIVPIDIHRLTCCDHPRRKGSWYACSRRTCQRCAPSGQAISGRWISQCVPPSSSMWV